MLHPEFSEGWCHRLGRGRVIIVMCCIQDTDDAETAAKNALQKMHLWSKAYDLNWGLFASVSEMHLNPANRSGSNEALLQQMMSLVVAAVETNATRLSKLFLSQELRCLTGLLPVGTMHYHQNMVPSNSHVLALIEHTDLPAFEAAFKAQQADDRPAGILGTSATHFFVTLSLLLLIHVPGQAASADPPDFAETVAATFGTSGLPLPHSPVSAGFEYRDDCRSSLNFARHVMLQDDIADAINGVRYVRCWSLSAQYALFGPFTLRCSRATRDLVEIVQKKLIPQLPDSRFDRAAVGAVWALKCFQRRQQWTTQCSVHSSCVVATAKWP